MLYMRLSSWNLLLAVDSNVALAMIVYHILFLMTSDMPFEYLENHDEAQMMLSGQGLFHRKILQREHTSQTMSTDQAISIDKKCRWEEIEGPSSMLILCHKNLVHG